MNKFAMRYLERKEAPARNDVPSSSLSTATHAAGPGGDATSLSAAPAGSSDNTRAAIESGVAEGEGEADVVSRSGKRKSHPDPDEGYHRAYMYGLGDKIRKNFPGYGIFEGAITRLPTNELPYYGVKYEDGDSEDIHADDMSQYVAEYKRFCRRDEPAAESSQQHVGQNEEPESTNDEEVGASASETKCVFLSSEEVARRADVSITLLEKGDIRSRRSTAEAMFNTERPAQPHAAEAAEANETPADTYSTVQAQESEPFSTDAEWTQYISGSDDRKIVRIMEFSNSSITADDPQGRLCSLWCLNKGYIASANRVVPEELLNDPDRALDYLRNEEKEKIKAKCLESPLFSDGIGHLCNYFLFACLGPGDLVILQMKSGDHAPGEAVFGFVEDDSFIIKSKDEVINVDAFPWKLDREEAPDPWANGLMLRRVKWMRRGAVRSLPGQSKGKKALWMHECVTSFLVEVTNTKKNGGLKRKALNAMRSEAFLRKTDPLNQVWVNNETARWSSSS